MSSKRLTYSSNLCICEYHHFHMKQENSIAVKFCNKNEVNISKELQKNSLLGHTIDS